MSQQDAARLGPHGQLHLPNHMVPKHAVKALIQRSQPSNSPRWDKCAEKAGHWLKKWDKCFSQYQMSWKGQFGNIS